MKQTQDGPKPAFAVYDNGCEQMSSERMGEELGIMTVDDIPKFFVELGKAVAAAGMTYEAFYAHYADKVRAIAAQYI